MSHLLVLFGPKRGVRIELGPLLVVGRGADAGLQLVDPKVSREHCRFSLTNASAAVEDLGSQNGTYVNGERLAHRHTLAEGDEVAVGDSLLVFDGTWEMTAARYDDVALLWGDERSSDHDRSDHDRSDHDRSDHDSNEGDPRDHGVPAQERDGTAPARVQARATLSEKEDDTLIDTIVRLARELDEAVGEEARARAVLQVLLRRFSPDRAFVLTKNPSGVRPLVGQSVGQHADGCVPLSRAVLEQAEAAGRALVIRDALTDRTLAAARSVARHQLRSVLVAPLIHHGHVTGFLHCDRIQPVYGAADARALDALAAVVNAYGLGWVDGRVDGRGDGRVDGRVDPGQAHVFSPGASSAGAPIRGASLAGRPRVAEPPTGQSPTYRAARARAEAAASTPSTVLITGETGVGKEDMARFIHAASPRAEGPFVVVNAGAIPDALAESQLFGHERGAFTGAVSTQLGLVEQADGGTLFLDEIGELGPSLQVKLLRVLQERAVQRLGAKVARRVDCRVLAATHRDLAADVRAGRFRQDLFYRLNVIEVRLPPLRERLEDLPALVDVLLVRLARTLGRQVAMLSSEALDALRGHDWPGNIRELSNVLERALVLRPPGLRTPLEADEVQAALGIPPPAHPAVAVAGSFSASSQPPGHRAGDQSGDQAGHQPGASPARPPEAAGPTLALKIAKLERAEIEGALRTSRGVKARAAVELGMSRPTLDKKIAELGIDLWKERGE